MQVPQGSQLSDTSFGTKARNMFELGLGWSDLSYTVKLKEGDKKILQGLTGTALPNRTLAVMGGSGAGKTTFLNCLAGRIAFDNKHVLDGCIQVNDVELSHKYRMVMGFVTQDDIVFPMATPADAFEFSLRIRRGDGWDVVHQKVNDTIEELGLEKCRDTISGIPGLVKGLSGGERKRTNIGVELICDPKILLLDEPTSGLDSVTSSKLMAQLQRIARNGRTIVYTIHQPNADCVSCFDDLLLLVQGRAVYHGDMLEALPYFASIGFDCPADYTPTDFFMTVMQNTENAELLIRSWEEKCNRESETMRHIHVAQRTDVASPTVSPEALKNPTVMFLQRYKRHQQSSYWIQAQSLMKRAHDNVFRNKAFLAVQILQAMVFSLVVGIIFVHLQYDFQGVQDRQGLLFIVITNAAFTGAMNVVHTFPSEKAVFIREQQSGAYSPFLYFVTRTIAELPITIISTLVGSSIVYFIPQLDLSAGRFFYFYAVVLMAVQVCQGIGLVISAAVSDYMISAALTPMVVIPMMLVEGLLGSSNRIDPYWRWLEKISPLRYAYVLLMKNEFESVHHFSCDANKFGTEVCMHAPRNGTAVLHNLGYYAHDLDVWIDWMCLAILFVATRFICVMTLYRIARTRS